MVEILIDGISKKEKKKSEDAQYICVGPFVPNPVSVITNTYLEKYILTFSSLERFD